MESGVLGRSSIHDMDFNTDGQGRQIPLPDELPPTPNLHHLPHEILTSSTVENLISQNEDLMARLKVSLRRLSTVEMENRRLTATAEDSRHRVAISDDQVLLLKEKDQVWKEKADELRKERDLLKEKSQILAERLSTAQSENGRHQRYQERIRNQVKPQMVQLKNYAKALEDKAAQHEAESTRQEAAIQDLRQQILEVTQNFRYQLEQNEVANRESIERYESLLSEMRDHNDHLGRSHAEAQSRLIAAAAENSAAADRLARSEDRQRKTAQRCDELENEIIELRRNQEELLERNRTEAGRWHEQTEGIVRERARLQIENEGLRTGTLADHERIKTLEQQNLDLQSQIESLRFMWQSQNETNEKMRLSLSALEKLNVDLSRKIQELRPSPTAP